MTSLQVLSLFAVIAMVWGAWRRHAIRLSRAEAIAFVALCCFVLLLALRFGARTYPGLYFPDSRALNCLFNGSGLFVGIGYGAVLIAFAASLVRTWVRPGRGTMNSALRAAFWLPIGMAALIALFGFYWAVQLGRLA